MTQKEKTAFEAPDFNKFAGSFDRFLGLIEPVGEAIFAHMPKDLADKQILDVACGTGEPGLTLAKRHPAATVTGVDAATNMIDIAEQKALAAQLQNISFKVMSSEALQFADNEFDVIISRFGLGMFGEIAPSAREALRVLKPGGSFVIAVWHDIAKNTFMKTMAEAANELLSTQKPTSGTMPGIEAEALFIAAGFANVACEPFSWTYTFKSEADLRAMIAMSAEHMLRAQFGELDERSKTAQAIETIMARFARFLDAQGVYQIPHTCLILQGSKTI